MDWSMIGPGVLPFLRLKMVPLGKLHNIAVYIARPRQRVEEVQDLYTR